mmetsp:Transcript_16282/g.35190  ORF Transcript_16282/g.35190 Transcript_16282/m.35190 type:complete len:305 (-) Transcript_16282:141-1055(-)
MIIHAGRLRRHGSTIVLNVILLLCRRCRWIHEMVWIVHIVLLLLLLLNGVHDVLLLLLLLLNTVWINHHLPWMSIMSHLRMMRHLIMIHHHVGILPIRTHHELILLKMVSRRILMIWILIIGLCSVHRMLLVLMLHLILILVLDMTSPSSCLTVGCFLRLLLLQLLLLILNLNNHLRRTQSTIAHTILVFRISPSVALLGCHNGPLLPPTTHQNNQILPQLPLCGASRSNLDLDRFSPRIGMFQLHQCLSCILNIVKFHKVGCVQFVTVVINFVRAHVGLIVNYTNLPKGGEYMVQILFVNCHG